MDHARRLGLPFVFRGDVSKLKRPRRRAVRFSLPPLWGENCCRVRSLERHRRERERERKRQKDKGFQRRRGGRPLSNRAGKNTGLPRAERS